MVGDAHPTWLNLMVDVARTTHPDHLFRPARVEPLSNACTSKCATWKGEYITSTECLPLHLTLRPNHLSDLDTHIRFLPLVFRVFPNCIVRAILVWFRNRRLRRLHQRVRWIVHLAMRGVSISCLAHQGDRVKKSRRFQTGGSGVGGSTSAL